MVGMHRDQIGFTHAIIRSYVHNDIMNRCRLKLAILFFPTNLRWDRVQELADFLWLQCNCQPCKNWFKAWYYNGRRFVEGVRVMLNTDFYTNIWDIKYVGIQYIYILFCQNWYLSGLKYICIFIQGCIWTNFNKKVLFVFIFFYFKKNNFEHWNITLRPGSEIK